MWAWDSTSAVMAVMGLRLFVVSILVVLEEFHCFLYVHDDFPALLHDGGLQEAVFVVLGCEVGNAEKCLDSFEPVNVAFAGVLGFLGCLAGVAYAQFCQEFFDVAHGEGGEGCCVFDDHAVDGYKWTKTQPVVQGFLLALEQRYIKFYDSAIRLYSAVYTFRFVVN